MSMSFATTRFVAEAGAGRRLYQQRLHGRAAFGGVLRGPRYDTVGPRRFERDRSRPSHWRCPLRGCLLLLYDGQAAGQYADLSFHNPQAPRSDRPVGPTGAGKTTAPAPLLHRGARSSSSFLLPLLLLLFDPQSGRITIDGIDLKRDEALGPATEHRRRVYGSAAVQPVDP